MVLNQAIIMSSLYPETLHLGMVPVNRIIHIQQFRLDGTHFLRE